MGGCGHEKHFDGTAWCKKGVVAVTINYRLGPMCFLCLPDEDVRWVEETIAGMTPEEKVGQLFFQLTASQDENYLRELMERCV